jgi:transposase-like protein
MNHQIHKNDHDQSKDFKLGADYEALILPVKTREIIAREYGIHVRTLRRWCKREGLEIPTSSLAPKHQRIIYETFGTPPAKKR